VLGLFFGAGPTSAGQTDSLLWPLRKLPGQFFSSPLDRLFVQARDLGEQPIFPSANAGGLHRHLPAALLFIQAAKPQIHRPM
jgi:hypothetical protein